MPNFIYFLHMQLDTQFSLPVSSFSISLPLPSLYLFCFLYLFLIYLCITSQSLSFYLFIFPSSLIFPTLILDYDPFMYTLSFSLPIFISINIFTSLSPFYLILIQFYSLSLALSLLLRK